MSKDVCFDICMNTGKIKEVKNLKAKHDIFVFKFISVIFS